jgi:general secretion pathway protein D
MKSDRRSESQKEAFSIAFCGTKRGVLAFAFIIATAVPLILGPSYSLRAQERAPVAAIEAQDVPLIQLSTRGNVPLSDLIDYVAGRLGVTYYYDQALRQKQVNLIAPDPLPVTRLEEILQNVLLSEGLIVSEPDNTGTRRISGIEKINEVVRPGIVVSDLSTIGAAVPVTRLIVLKNIAPTKMVELVKPFLSKGESGAIALENRSAIIITDAAANVRRVAEFIELIDSGSPLIDVRFVTAKHVGAEALAKQLQLINEAKLKASGKEDEQGQKLEVSTNTRSNQVVLIGSTQEIERAIKLLETLDSQLPTIQRAFSLEFMSPDEFDEVIRRVLADRGVQPPYQSRVEGNVLVVDTTDEVIELMTRLRRNLDTRNAPLAHSPIRFYKIKNVPAQELARTLQSLSTGGRVPANNQPENRRLTTNDLAVPGPNRSPFESPGIAQPVREPLAPPAMRSQDGVQNAALGDGLEGAMGNSSDERIQQQIVETIGLANQQPGVDPLMGTAQVTVDVHTNTIIVVADPSTQRVYASLIENLDKRSPQVLIEAKIVIIDTSNDYTLGVEVSGGDRSGAKKLFAFNSYGLSNVDPVSGALRVIPGVGFNGTLVDPSTADVVVRAIANHRRARVLSTPRVLVNDNAEGQLTSVLEVPFTSVNASQTVATTSFAGFAEAGTTITVTPTISEEDYLQLEYVVTLNSFSGTGTAGVPPPRQTNEVRSRVTVPDGYTVIVGGLVSKNGSFEVNTIPWVEKIPVLRDLASLQSKSDSETSLFVFLRPVILREDQFRDLKYFSGPRP